MAERWEKLQQAVVEPHSALELLVHDRQRKRPRQHYSSPTTTALSSSLIMFPCCLLQHPAFSLTPGSITEVAGPAGAGKTQLALSLCVDTVMMPGVQQQQQQENGGDCANANIPHSASVSQPKAVYILLGGSGRFLQTISRRLQQMIQARSEENDAQYSSSSSSNDPSKTSEYAHNCLTRIFVKWVCNTEDFLEMLRNSLPKLLQDHEPEVVVLDGIASLFRLQDGSSHRSWHQERAGTFFEISQLCRELSAEFQTPFVVVNEATSRIGDSGKTALEPALGLSWQQCVNSSFFVSRCGGGDIQSSGNGETTNHRRRRLKCLKAPHIATGNSVDFFIDRTGAVVAMQGGTQVLLTPSEEQQR